MQGIRSSSRWLLFGASISRQYLLLPDRALFQYPSRHNLRQFCAISPRYDRRGNFASPKPSEQRRSPQPSRDAEKFTNPAKNTVPQFLLWLVFPFAPHAASTLSLYRTIRPHGGFRRQAFWLYRILWLLGIGYTASSYILPSSPSTESHAVFNPPRFTPFSIIDRVDVSPTSFILTLRPHTNTSNIEPYANSWDRGTWSVEFKQPQLQIARSYTPLPPTIDAPNSSDLQFLIRREKGGEVSNYLANLPLQATIHIRGPHPEIDLPTDTTDIVFLAGGTGIAPAMQVAYTLLERRTDTPKPKIHIVWANRKREDCMGGISSLKTGRTEVEGATDRPMAMVRELQRLRHRYPEHLSIDYFVDEERTFLDQKTVSATTAQAAKDSAGNGMGSKLLFVSGPEGFVNFLAGPKRWEDGEEKQGDLGGVIGQVGLKGWQVWKM